MLRRAEPFEPDSPVPALGVSHAADRSHHIRGTIVAAIAVVVMTTAVHGWSLFDGLALDDYWHYRTVQACGWSPGELLGTTTIRAEDLIDSWWQKQSVSFKYARPVSVALMKLVYAATDGSVFGQHLCNLLLHVVAAMLLYRLCVLLTGRLFWSSVGAILFAVYPSSVFTVGWLAAQNMLLVTVLMLAALLAYVRASGLCLRIDRQGRESVASPPLKRGAAAVAIGLWTAALFSRENAIMLPVVLVLLDLAFGGRRHCRARLGMYAALAAIGGAFLIWRFGVYYEPMPDVYVRRPDGHGYLLWCAAKLLHYLACSVWLAPMTIGPTGRYNPFSEAPYDYLLMLAIVMTAGVLFWLAARRARGYWIWPVWMLLAVGPVVPVLATPHSGYLCGVPIAIGFILGPALPTRSGRVRRLGGWCGVVALVAVVACTAFDKANRLMWRGMSYAEHFVTESLPEAPLPSSVKDVYFLNLPFAAIYAPQAMRLAWPGRADDISWHVLTFSPDIVRMEQPCVVEQIDDRRFTVRVEGRPYFSGLLGRFLVNGFGRREPFKIGQKSVASDFDIEIREADAEGVRQLEFSFHGPLTDPSRRFYVTSGEFGAMPLRFERGVGLTHAVMRAAGATPSMGTVSRAVEAIRNGDVDAGDVILAAMDADDPAIRTAGYRAMQDSIEIAARASAASVLPLLESTSLDRDGLGRIRNWWHISIEPRALRRLFEHRDHLMDIRHRRDELERGPALIGRYIHSDLYLTGAPFPGPQP